MAGVDDPGSFRPSNHTSACSSSCRGVDGQNLGFAKLHGAGHRVEDFWVKILGIHRLKHVEERYQAGAARSSPCALDSCRIDTHCPHPLNDPTS